MPDNQFPKGVASVTVVQIAYRHTLQQEFVIHANRSDPKADAYCFEGQWVEVPQGCDAPIISFPYAMKIEWPETDALRQANAQIKALGDDLMQLAAERDALEQEVKMLLRLQCNDLRAHLADAKENLTEARSEAESTASVVNELQGLVMAAGQDSRETRKRVAEFHEADDMRRSMVHEGGVTTYYENGVPIKGDG